MSTDETENGSKTLRPGQENVITHRSHRQKGSGNKIPPGAKRQFIEAFQLIGGAHGLYRWANKARRTKNSDGTFTVTRPNLGLFYELAARLIPAETNVRGDFFVGHYIATPRATLRQEQKQQDTDADDNL